MLQCKFCMNKNTCRVIVSLGLSLVSRECRHALLEVLSGGEGGPHHHSPRLRHQNDDETARRRQRKSSSASWSSPAAAVYLTQFSAIVSISVSTSRGTIEEHQSAHCTSPPSTVGVWLKTIIISSAKNRHLHIVSALHLYAK